MFDIKEELKNLPEQPGVYLMHSADDVIIYVGKAKILKNRVRQYFQNSAAHTPKVRAMVSNIAYFEYIVTDTEMEALVLECNLIKKHKPKYNILLKDDKHYPYIKVTMNEPYPRVFMTRKMQNDGARYFGPYSGSNTIKNTLDIIQKIFHPPMCARKFPEDIGKGRPCLNYHIKNCFAPCTGNVGERQYKAVFAEICAFLEGKHTALIKSLEDEMKCASRELEFEKAAVLRDKIASIKAIDEKQKIINSKQTDGDIVALITSENKAFTEVFFVRSGKIVGRENYRIDDVADLTDGQIMTDFVKQFYSNAGYIPQEILLEVETEDMDLLQDWLSERRGKSVSLQVPKRGEKKQLIEMVKRNAQIAADNFKVEKLKYEQKNSVLARLAECLRLENEPKRIESYDISNISGSDNVGAMVVFRNGYPDKKAYRKFKIKGFDGQDDYAAMCEVIYRRFRHALEESDAIEQGRIRIEDAKFLPIPDLILLDGGKGHVSTIKALLEQIDTNVPVFGMVKDNKHRTRAMISADGKEIEISMISNVFNFVTKVQDEVHRTAITYHRQLHRKQAVKSELDNISGVGEKRKSALLEQFKSVDKIKNASFEELSKAVDRKTAKSVYDYFNRE